MTPEPEAYERWACELDSLFAHAWQRLTRGVHDRHAPARHPTLATVSPEGWPQARTVVLRGADKARSCIEIHTHLHSPKIDDLRAEPRAAVHVWDNGSRLQMRLQAQVEIISGPEAAQAWARVPDASRGIIDPITLQMASVFEPFCRASRCAAIVSAVSPDCEITTVNVRSSTIGSR